MLTENVFSVHEVPTPSNNGDTAITKSLTERHRKSIYNIILEIYKMKNFAWFFIFEILRLDFSKFNSIYTSETNQDVKINISHQQIQKINVFAYNFDLINNNRSPPSEGVRSSLLDVLECFFMSLRKLFFACTNG